MNAKILTIGIPAHFRPTNANIAACGVECPEFSAYDGRDVNCLRCQKTNAWKVYMGKPVKKMKKKTPKIKYIRGKGYCILRKDGTREPGYFYAKKGAEAMVNGTFNSHAFTP